jgi:hypothetical protein
VRDRPLDRLRQYLRVAGVVRPRVLRYLALDLRDGLGDDPRYVLAQRPRHRGCRTRGNLEVDQSVGNLHRALPLRGRPRVATMPLRQISPLTCNPPHTCDGRELTKSQISDCPSVRCSSLQ